MKYSSETKTHGSIRTMKAGGAAGVVLGLAAVGLAMGTSTVRADEKVVEANQPKVQETGVEVKESTIKNETATGNAATNLNAPAGAISDKQKAYLSNENKVTGETPVTIDHTKVQEEAKKAEQVGVNVVQDKTQVAPTTSTAEDTAKAVKSITAKENEKSNELKSTATAHSTAVSNWVDQKNSTVAFNNELDKAHLKAVESYNDFIKTLDADTAAVVAQHKDAIIKVTEVIQKASDGTSVEGYQAYIRSLAEQQGINKDAIKDYLVKKAEYNSKSTANSETVVRNISNSTRIDAENKAKSQSVDAENTRRSTSAQKVVEENTAKSNSTVAENNRLSTSAKTENERRSNSAKAVENDNNAKSLSVKAENEKRSNSAKAENERRSNSAEEVKADNIAKSNSVVEENNKRSNSAKAENERRSNSAKAVENDNIAKSNSVIEENNKRSNSAKAENEKRSNAAKNVESDNVAKSNSVVAENNRRSQSADAENIKRSNAAQQGITNERERSLAVVKENERLSNSAQAETARRSNSAKAENEKRSNAVKKVEDDNRTKSLSVVAENNKRSNAAKAETARRSQSAAAENAKRSNSVKAENDKLLANYNSSMTAYRTAKTKYDNEKAAYNRKLAEYNKQKLQGQGGGVKLVGNFNEAKKGSLDYFSNLTAIFDEDKDLEVVKGSLGANAKTTITLDAKLQEDKSSITAKTKKYGGTYITGIQQGSKFTLHNVGTTDSGKTISATFTSRSKPVPLYDVPGNKDVYTRMNVWWNKVTGNNVSEIGFYIQNYLNVEWDINFFDEVTKKPIKLGLVNLYSDLDYNQAIRYTYDNSGTGAVVNPPRSNVKEVTVRGEKYWAGVKTDGVWKYDDPSPLKQYRKGDPGYVNVGDVSATPEGTLVSVGKGTVHHLTYLQSASWSLSPYSKATSLAYKKYVQDQDRANGRKISTDRDIFEGGYAFQLWGGKSVISIPRPPKPPVEPKKPQPRRDDAQPITFKPATYDKVTFQPTPPPKYVPVTFQPATYKEIPYTPGKPVPYVPVSYEKVTYKPGDTSYKPVTYEKVNFTPADNTWTPVTYEKVNFEPRNSEWTPVGYEKVNFSPSDTAWEPVGYTPLKFTPKNTDWNPVPYVPTPYVPEKLVEVPKEPVLDLAKLTAPTDPVFHKIPKEPKVPTVHYHLTALNENTPVEKLAQNEDGVNINNESVAKNSTNHFILKPKALPAGRPITTSIVLSDYMADGIELDIAGMQKANKAWDISYNNSTRLLEVKGVEAEYDKANADRTVPYTPTAFTIIYKVLSDGATYENVFKMDINGGAKGGNPNGYTSYSNKVRIHTPGSPTNPNDPRNPNGGGNHKIQPVKNNTNKEGKNINDKTLLQTDVNYYVAEWDLDQYINDKSSKSAIAKGFGYLENYPEKAVTPFTKDYYVVTSKGEKVEGLDFYEADSAKLNKLPEFVQQFIKDSGIDVSNFGKFQVWIAKDSQAFYNKYVKTGQDIFFHLPMAVNKGFTGKYENQTYQIDFGNGYYGNVVRNNVPNLTPKKDVVVDGKSANGGTITYGQEFSYLLSGTKLPSNRGSHVWEYRYIDDYDQTGDKYLGKYKVIATTDITVSQLEEVKEDTTFKEDVTLEDGTVVKAGQKVAKGLKVRRTHVIKTGEDVTKFTEAVHDEANGIITISFKEDFLKSVVDSSEFGADASIDMKRIAYGEFYNKYANRVNGVDYISNTVKTTTPKPPTPEQPKQPQLPYTGTSESSAPLVGMAILSVLGLAGLVRRRNQ